MWRLNLRKICVPVMCQIFKLRCLVFEICARNINSCVHQANSCKSKVSSQSQSHLLFFTITSDCLLPVTTCEVEPGLCVEYLPVRVRCHCRSCQSVIWPIFGASSARVGVQLTQQQRIGQKVVLMFVSFSTHTKDFITFINYIM